MSGNKDILRRFDRTAAVKFVKSLLKWNRTQNKREMPWKGEKDPYKIWLSEIILQQTRVEQGLAYYEHFVSQYPAVKDLALAPEQEIFKLWEGLGYYTRCKNLIHTAKHIHFELNGIFPHDHASILSLKGIGGYTAAAISSFAYNLPYAVLDGNVFRVLSRIFDVDVPIDTTQGKALFSDLAQSIIPPKEAAAYNQAIMDFGATICKPVPECAICFFNTNCSAFLQNKQLSLPVKLKKLLVKERWLNYIILKYKNQYAIRQRVGKDVWQSLYEFLQMETKKAIAPKKLFPLLQNNYEFDVDKLSLLDESTFKQRLSHQLIHFHFLVVEAPKRPNLPESFIWVKASELASYPFPKTLQHYIGAYLL